jgi:hypothetical protein
MKEALSNDPYRVGFPLFVSCQRMEMEPAINHRIFFLFTVFVSETRQWMKFK